MKKIEKEKIIKKYQDILGSYCCLFLIKNSGLTVQHSKEIRNSLTEIGMKFIVVKNSLAKLAFDNSKFDAIKENLHGPVVIAFSNEPISAAKMITSFIKNSMPMEILSASIDGKVLESREATSLSKMMTENEIHAKMLGLLKALPNKLVRSINEPGLRLVRVLNAHTLNQ